MRSGAAGPQVLQLIRVAARDSPGVLLPHVGCEAPEGHGLGGLQRPGVHGVPGVYPVLNSPRGEFTPLVRGSPQQIITGVGREQNIVANDGRRNVEVRPSMRTEPRSPRVLLTGKK